MAQPRRRRRRLLAALLVLLSLCCLARLGGAASAASAASGTHRKDGAAIPTEKAAGQGHEAARGFSATRAEDELPARMEMEVDVQDYPGANANARHDPGYARGPQHP